MKIVVARFNASGWMEDDDDDDIVWLCTIFPSSEPEVLEEGWFANVGIWSRLLRCILWASELANRSSTSRSCRKASSKSVAVTTTLGSASNTLAKDSNAHISSVRGRYFHWEGISVFWNSWWEVWMIAQRADRASLLSCAIRSCLNWRTVVSKIGRMRFQTVDFCRVHIIFG